MAQESEFWTWFAEHAAEIKKIKSYESKSMLVDELDERLRKIGISSWEIGPSLRNNTVTALVLSPGGRREGLALTKRLVSAAPAIPGWEVLPAKPPKDWKRFFYWSDRRVPIDASSWRFLLLDYPDGQIEFVLTDNPLSHISAGNRRGIIYFVLESELGEEFMIERVCSVGDDISGLEEKTAMSLPISDLRAKVGS